MINNLRTQLLAELSRRNIDIVTQYALDNSAAIEQLVNLTILHEDKVSARAAWVLEKLSERKPNCLDQYMPFIISSLSKYPISGIRRCMAKVVMLHNTPEISEGELLDFCLNMIESPKEPVAVKANCMTIIFNLLPKYPELKNELFAIIEDQIQHSTVGLGSRFNVLKRKYKFT